MNEQDTQGPENPPDSPVGDDRTSDVERLRDLAAKATPGPWQYNGQVLSAGRHRIGDTQDVCCFGHSGQECTDEQMESEAVADVAYIAALSPDVLTGLLDRLESAERITEAARSVIEGWHDGAGPDHLNARLRTLDSSLSQPHSAEGGRDE